MARPITWQDVVAPKTGGILAASALAAKNFTNSLDRINERFGAIGQNMNQAATEAAAAHVMNSTDPLAAAAGLPQDPHINPLAVAEAAQARSKDLLATRATEAQLRSNELQGEIAKATLDDRLASNEGADLALPYRDLIFSGQKPNIDLTDSRWQSAAGREALKFIDGWQKEYNDQAYQQKSLALQASQARAAQLQLDQVLSQRAAADGFSAWRLGPGANADLSEIQDMAQYFAEKSGAGTSFTAQLLSTYGGENAKGLTSERQFDQTAKGGGGGTYRDIDTALALKADQLEEAKLIEKTQGDIAAAGAAAMETNNYKGVTPGAMWEQFRKNNPDIGKGLARDWDVSDFNERVSAQKKFSNREAAGIAREMGVALPENFVPLTPAQLTNLVELTKGEVVLFSDSTEDSAAARELRKEYIRYNLAGGAAGHAHRQALIDKKWDSQIQLVNKARRKNEDAAQKGTEVPTTAREIFQQTPTGQAFQQVPNDSEWAYLLNRSLQNAGK